MNKEARAGGPSQTHTSRRRVGVRRVMGDEARVKVDEVRMDIM